MVYDCFTFYNEFDVLEIRLALLYKHVDFFVIVEADKTWRNNPKPLFFEQQTQRFAKYADKIKHIIVTDLPNDKDPWVLEAFQRNAIARGLTGCSDNDTIFICDVDEIWDPRILTECSVFPSRIEMPFYYYTLNYRVNNLWIYPMICTYAEVKATTPNDLRQKSGIHSIFKYKDTDMSFHLSFLYGKEYNAYINKIESFSHSEFDRPWSKNKNHIRCCIKYGIDVFLRSGVTLTYHKQSALMQQLKDINVQKYYYNRNIISLIPSLSDCKALYRIYLQRKYPFINYGNPTLNTLKFLIIQLFKRKLKTKN